MEIHGFSVSSQKAYGSAVYLCAEDEDKNRVSNLITAKSRVAPMKRIALPRLELLAAFITAKLLHYVVQALRISVYSVYAWLDSQIALAPIRKPSSCWKVFVANRVQEIQKKVPPSQWRFCPGARFSKVPKCFQTRKAITNISTLKFTELFFSHLLNMNKVVLHAKFYAYTLLCFQDTGN